jgi:hypothetical protein
MTDKDITLAYLENLQLEATADYVRRGRPRKRGGIGRRD